MAAARTACCCLLVLLTVACGSGGARHARKDAVNAYFGRVGAAQATLLGDQGQINVTLQAFSLTKAPPTELQRLRHERRTVVATMKRLRALDPPPEATHLHALLVRRIRLQVALFDAVIETMQDVPRLAAVGPPLTAAAHRLRLDLAAIGGTKVVLRGGSQAFLARYADAFGRYGDTLEPIGRSLPVAARASLLRPTIASERTVIAQSTRLCDAIRSSLRRGDVGAANVAIHELLTLTQLAGGEPVRRAQEVVARSYDARVAQIDRLASAISEERLRLVRRVG